ncbi:UNVERIFIED_CONTAM: L-type lectin-domain containing receptor kinase VIII.1 [Sesamum latifolium]|uniref:L-type lectin-domain containing receptor kinase VIII.1 n=1 Tax=Sesamum latifolium TaxID=2727402 RepID=A0AAW2VAE7_9LAMI
MTSLSGGFSVGSVFVGSFVLLFFFSCNVLTATEFDFGSLTLSSLKLLGDAHLSNGSVRLTRDLGVPNSGSGKVLYSKPVKFRRAGVQSPASFSTSFSFSVTNLNPSSIGGGLAFVISPDDEFVGDAGGFLGIMDAKGAPKGVVAVEFDTLMDVEFEDINGNHVGLDLNSMVSAEVGDLETIDVDLKSGDLVNSWVDYSGPGRAIKVYVSYSNSKPEEPIISATFDLDDYIMNDIMFVGFSGSTQGSTEIHTIHWWNFSSSFDEHPRYNPVSPTGSPPPPGLLMNPTADTAYLAPPSLAPESDNSNSTSHGKGSSGKCRNPLCRKGAVVGVVIATAFFLALCALAFIWAYSKKFKNDKTWRLWLMM